MCAHMHTVCYRDLPGLLSVLFVQDSSRRIKEERQKREAAEREVNT